MDGDSKRQRSARGRRYLRKDAEELDGEGWRLAPSLEVAKVLWNAAARALEAAGAPDEHCAAWSRRADSKARYLLLYEGEKNRRPRVAYAGYSGI